MIIPEFVRTIILGNPISLPENSTELSFILSQLKSNYILLIFLLGVVALCVFIFFVSYIRKRNTSSTYLLYVSGIFLFFTALILKLYQNPNKTDQNQNSWAAKSFLVGFRPFKALLRDSGTSSNAHSFFISQNMDKSFYTALSGSLAKNVSIKESKIESFFDLPLYDDHKGAKVSVLKKENINLKTEKESEKTDEKKTEKKVIIEPNHETILVEKSNKIKASENVLIAENDQNPKINKKATKSIPQQTTLDSPQESTESLDKTKKTDPEPKSSSTSANDSPDAVKVENSAGIRDQFIKRVLNVLKNEFLDNNAISSYFQNLNLSIDKILSKTRSLDLNLKVFLETSSKIQSELLSFNASTENYDAIASDLINGLKSLNMYKNILENLNYKNSSDYDLNNIFKIKSLSAPNSKDEGISPDTSSFHQIIVIVLMAQFFFGILFLYSVIVRNNSIFVCRMIVISFLIFDVLSCVIFMAKAHFLDKECILGRVKGCESNFSPAFANFAASTNINLKKNLSAKLSSISRSFEKIQLRTDNIVSVLKTIYEDDVIPEINYKIHKFKNLFNKIKFVEDDFNELTHSKISKEQYFKLINNIEVELLYIELNFRSIDSKKQIDFYTREVVFLNFIKSEKINILKIIENQIEENRSDIRKKTLDECQIKKKLICKEKDNFDVLYMILLVGPLVFMGFLLF